MILKTGAIYSLRYVRWKTNYRIYAFIMFPGGGSTKTHLLNIGAKQLNILDRAKIVRVIVQLSKIPNSNKYNGRLLYKIFKSYLPREIKKCYRTFFTNYITQASLINYGLNKSEDFTELELSSQSKELFEQAQKDFQVKAMNLYSKRGVKLNEVKKTMAGDNSGLIKEEENKVSTITPGTKSATKSAVKEDNIVKEQSKTDDDDFGY